MDTPDEMAPPMKMQFNLLVTGSRSFNNYGAVQQALHSFVTANPDVRMHLFTTGRMTGAEKMASSAWEQYGGRGAAVPSLLGDEEWLSFLLALSRSDAVMVFIHNGDPDAENRLSRARQDGKPVYAVRVEDFLYEPTTTGARHLAN